MLCVSAFCVFVLRVPASCAPLGPVHMHSLCMRLPSVSFACALRVLSVWALLTLEKKVASGIVIILGGGSRLEDEGEMEGDVERKKNEEEEVVVVKVGGRLGGG